MYHLQSRLGEAASTETPSKGERWCWGLMKWEPNLTPWLYNLDLCNQEWDHKQTNHKNSHRLNKTPHGEPFENVMLKVISVATPLEHRWQGQGLRAKNVGQHTAACGGDGRGRCWHCCHWIPASSCSCGVCRWSEGQPAELGPIRQQVPTGKLLVNLFKQLKVLWYLTRRDL